MKYDWERLLALGYSESTVESLKKAHTENPMDEMAIAPALKKEPATNKPLMGQSAKRFKSKSIIQ